MAVQLDGAGRDLAAPQRRDAPRRRRSPLLVAAAVAGLLALVAVLVWPLVSAYERSRVHVVMDAGALQCDNTRVRTRSVGPTGTVTVPLADITADMACTLRARIVNRAHIPVRIERVVVPLAGSDAGAGVYARVLQGESIEPRPDEVDAIFDLDGASPLAAGEESVVEILLVNQPGCMSPGSHLYVTDAPIITVDVLGHAGVRAPLGEGYGFHGTAFSSCDEE